MLLEEDQSLRLVTVGVDTGLLEVGIKASEGEYGGLQSVQSLLKIDQSLGSYSLTSLGGAKTYY